MYGYIYLTTNIINGKKYIGQKKSDKFLGTKYLGSGSILIKAINKYGRNNFKVELLCECSSKEDLDNKEIYYIAKYNAQTNINFYNICRGGESGQGGPKFKGHHHTEQTKQLLSSLNKGSKNHFYGRKHSEETRLCMKEKAKFRKPVSQETRAKLSKVHKGKVFSEEHKNNIRLAQLGEKGNNYGKKLSESTKQKIVNTMHNKIWITDNIVNKRINSEDLEEYINKGFRKGRLSFKKGSTTIESILKD